MSEDLYGEAISFFESSMRTKAFSIRPLEGGTGNAIFLINLDSVLRLHKENRVDAPFYNPRHEYETTLHLSSKATPRLIPQAFVFDPENGNKIERFIAEKEASHETDATYRYYLSLIDTLHRFHELTPKVPSFYPFERFDHYKKLSGESIRLDYETLILEKTTEVFDASPIVFCHNDLHKGNLLLDSKDNRMKLLDLEMAGYNYEIFDVASFIEENELPYRLAERLIHAYYGIKHATAKTVENVLLVGEFLDLLWYYWAKARYNETLNQTFLDIAKVKMGRIAKNIRHRFG